MIHLFYLVARRRYDLLCYASLQILKLAEGIFQLVSLLLCLQVDGFLRFSFSFRKRRDSVWNSSLAIRSAPLFTDIACGNGRSRR